MNEIIEGIRKYWKRTKKENKKELMKKKYKNLSLVERDAYESIIKRRDVSYVFVFSAPIYAIFYISLFSLIVLFAFEIDITEPILTIIQNIILLIPIFFGSWILLSLINKISLNRLRRELLLES